MNGIRHFISQVCVESECGNKLTERWDGNSPEEYFSDRVGMQGNKSVEDAVKFSGGGYIQLTHRDAYEQFAKHVGDEKIVELGRTYVAENYAWEAAAWYWTEYKAYANLKEKADSGASVKTITKIVNGGYTDLEKREKYYAKACEIFK